MTNFFEPKTGEDYSSFKEGEYVICINNMGFRNDLTLNEKYLIVKSYYHEYNADMIDILGDHKVLTGIFCSRFINLKLERKKKLKKIEQWKILKHS